MEVFDAIKDLLDKENIQYELFEHISVRTSEEAAKVRGVSLHAGAKSMVVKAGAAFILCILPADMQVDWKKVKEITNTKRIRLATEEEAFALTHVEMGSVPPFGNILGLQAYIDPVLIENEFLYFNPGSKTHTIKIRATDWQKVSYGELVSIAKFANEMS